MNKQTEAMVNELKAVLSKSKSTGIQMDSRNCCKNATKKGENGRYVKANEIVFATAGWNREERKNVEFTNINGEEVSGDAVTFSKKIDRDTIKFIQTMNKAGIDLLEVLDAVNGRPKAVAAFNNELQATIDKQAAMIEKMEAMLKEALTLKG